MDHSWSLAALGTIAFLAGGCLSDPPGEEGSGALDTQKIGPQLLPDGHSVTCGGSPEPQTLAYQPLTAPVPHLQPSGDIPLPSLGPLAPTPGAPYGTFFPPPGYIEGGTFAPVTPSNQAMPGRGPAWLRVAEWNTYRGADMDGAIETMRRVNADIWILSETDLYGAMAHGTVAAREMARALGYSYVTTVEFYEKKADRMGMSGNAILSRYPLHGARMMYLPLFTGDEPGFDWDDSGAIDEDEEKTGGHDWADPNSLPGREEPRCGQRSALAAYVDVPTESGLTRSVQLVSVHTENFEAFDLIPFRGARIRRLQVQAVRHAMVVPGEATIMAGDLNTLGLEPIAFRRFLANELKMVGGDPLHGSPRAFVDCSYGDHGLTHGAGHLDWLLSQEGENDAITCEPGAYQVIDSRGSDHRAIMSDFFVRAPIVVDPSLPPQP